MRQVPRYALIGRGRMAKHMCHYFDGLGLLYQTWCRAEHSPEELSDILSQSTHVLLLISDNAIHDFIEQYQLNMPQYAHLIKIHFSGSLISPLAYSAHPLQTFAHECYSLSEYEALPFIIQEDGPSFEELLPGLRNPHYRISSSDKPYYHAMCMKANNFTTILWQKFFGEMAERFHIPQKDLLPFLKQTFQNIEKDPSTALTGPIPRKDTQTLKRNLLALEGDDFQPIFKAFIETYFPEIQNEIHS